MREEGCTKADSPLRLKNEFYSSEVPSSPTIRFILIDCTSPLLARLC